ncbi:hypothetical protein [Faecalibacterium gallinarum]|uniref:hypothetical protein n=1 Tax=Faecalibacterium gallinarum TaxID=2903556 RepID=UPI001EE279AC|nr:hypothetical protein [Faecalibacterium gallinarum]
MGGLIHAEKLLFGWYFVLQTGKKGACPRPLAQEADPFMASVYKEGCLHRKLCAPGFGPDIPAPGRNTSSIAEPFSPCQGPGLGLHFIQKTTPSAAVFPGDVQFGKICLTFLCRTDNIK